VRAEAEVLADPETDVPVWMAVDREAERIVEHLLVAVRRGIEQAQVVARADLFAADLDVLGGGAAELDHGRGPAHDLLDRRVDERRVRAQALPLLGVLEEREQ